MSQQLINRNPDLQKLQSEGFDLEIRDGQIYVHHVPFLNSKQEVRGGTLAFTYSAQGNIINPPSDHTAHWIGEDPYTHNGEVIPSLINKHLDSWNGYANVLFLSLFPDSLPNRKYPNTYTKIITYYNTIAGFAQEKDRMAAERIKRITNIRQEDDVFHYQDSNSARAGIIGLSNKLRGKKTAIIGLGGSGSYLLDFLAKAPVAEIHLYDDDIFATHNAFRAPGAPSLEELEKGAAKVEYFSSMYAKMHRHIIPHSERITETNISNLFGLDMVFLCIDSVKARNFISRHLIEHNVPFIDSGLGLMLRSEQLAGQVRITCYNGSREEHISSSFGTEDIDDDVYATNIQVAELNCMAAVHMFIQWKRLLGFYFCGNGLPLEMDYNIGMNKILNSDENQSTNPNVC